MERPHPHAGFQNAVPQHSLRAGKAQRVCALFVRLEHQLHTAIQLALMLFQHLGSGKQHSCVRVVPAGVRRAAHGGKRKARFLFHGQWHPYRHAEESFFHPACPPLPQCPSCSCAAAHTPMAFSFSSIKSAGLCQVKPKFRVTVQPAAVFHQLRLRSLHVPTVCSSQLRLPADVLRAFFHGAEAFC